MVATEIRGCIESIYIYMANIYISVSLLKSAHARGPKPEASHYYWSRWEVSKYIRIYAEGTLRVPWAQFFLNKA